MRFNINDNVRVKLTDEGRARHKADHEALLSSMPEEARSDCPYSALAPKEDADGWSEWQLWNLMDSFGPYLRLGGPTLLN